MNTELSRRRFLELGCKVGAGALVTTMTGCFSGQFNTTPNQKFLDIGVSGKRSVAALGMFNTNDLAGVCEDLIPKISDLSWLSPGDSVFIKVACNSNNDHPAVTNPKAIPAVVTFLKNHGAGTVYVGDQSGVESVRLTENGRTSSTRELMKKNRLLDAVEASGATLHCFDDQGWDGYFNDQPDFKSTWEKGVWLPNIINDVDHIIYLPRLGSHALAGYTCAVKNAVGWLRDDSRQELHQKGDTFFEKFAEINHFPAIRHKFRFALTIADSALLNIGPDIGSKYTFDGTLFLGSENLVDHDYLASLLLRWFDGEDMSALDMINMYPNQVNFWNKRLVKNTWGKEAQDGYLPILPFDLDKNIEYDSCLSHLGWLQGYRPGDIEVRKQGGGLSDKLVEYMTAKGAGLIFV
jgi:uncharacterized protein (DUF362 family)